jgi:hypothetical protein
MATLTELVNEVVERGYQYESTTTIEASIQRHYQRLEGRYNWPWREGTKEGVAPFEIKDLRGILSVENTTAQSTIYGQSRQWLAEHYPDLEESGSPAWWWLDSLTLRIFPTSTSENISVRYLKRPEKLTASTEPAMPPEWHYLIVDLAVIDALKNNDQYDTARELKESVEADLQQMVAAELKRDLQSNPLTTRTGSFYL